MGGALVIQPYCLGPEDQVLVNTPFSRSVINGPKLAFVGLGKSGQKRKGILLGPTEYIVVEDSLTGNRRVEKGPALCFLRGYDKLIKRDKALALGPGDYVKIKDTVTGELFNVVGPCSHFLGAYDKTLERRKAITLKHDEYVRLVDEISGEIRVERGEKAVYVSPTEKLMENGKKRAVSVDAETAVLVQDTQTGKQSLVTDEQLFFPGPFEKILNVQSLIKLAEYETVIVKDRVGQYHFISGVMPGIAIGNHSPNSSIPMGTVASTPSDKKLVGNVAGGADGGADGDGDFEIEIRAGSKNNSGGGVAFFLPPHCSLVELMWSSGIHKDKRTLKRSVFDSRPWFCNYEFVCRTSDNVELTLELTFFWSLDNVPAMIRNTDDAPGDICHHARSEIVQSVSKVDLRTFMEKFNVIVKDTVIEADDGFYGERGVRIHSVEVRSFQCRDASIDKVLQNIIKETTDRINRLQKIESENEVRLEEMRGRIETERLKGGLIDVKNAHQRKEALMEGEAEAERIRAFIDGLCKHREGSDSVVTKDDSIALFNLLRRVEIFANISKGDAHLYLTPDDADLRIATNVMGGGSGSGGAGHVGGKGK